MSYRGALGGARGALRLTDASDRQAIADAAETTASRTVPRESPVGAGVDGRLGRGCSAGAHHRPAENPDAGRACNGRSGRWTSARGRRSDPWRGASTHRESGPARSSARTAGTVCRRFAAGRVSASLNRARRTPQGRTGGVQALVLQRLTSVPRDAPIAVFGLGEIGQAMLRALADAGFTAVESFNRASMRAFDGAVQRVDTLIVASGAPHAWLTLPPATGIKQVFDLGSPLQIVAAPGWRLTALDELLDGNGAVLPEAEFAALEMECAGVAEDLPDIARAATERHTRGDDRHANRIHAKQTTRFARRTAATARAQGDLRGQCHDPSVHLGREARRAMNVRNIGSRGSDLALWQSRTVLASLRAAAPRPTGRRRSPSSPRVAISISRRCWSARWRKGFFTRGSNSRCSIPHRPRSAFAQGPAHRRARGTFESHDIAARHRRRLAAGAARILCGAR